MMKESVISSMALPVMPAEVRKIGESAGGAARSGSADSAQSATAQGTGSTAGNLAKTAIKAESPIDQALTQQSPAELASTLAQYNEEELSEVVQSLNDYLQTVQRDLEFAVDQDSGRTVITVRDRENQEIIRQIPPEDVIAMSNFLRDEGKSLDSFGVAEEV